MRQIIPTTFPANQTLIKFNFLEIVSENDTLEPNGSATFLLMFYNETKEITQAVRLSISGDDYKRWGTMGSTKDAAYKIAIELMQAQGLDIILQA